MNLNLAIPKNIENVQPKISVIGVGGAGCNAVNTMINSKVKNINFLVANTDGQALSRSMASTQIQLGKELTNGLGAGSDYTIGEQAALETIDEIMLELEDVNMLFIATGMGGGTGTGAAPIIAQKAKEKGILTIAVVTKPFDFEGKKRMETALIGLEKLENSVDTLIVIPNQNLFRIANEKTTFSEAFQLADDVLYQGIIGITDLITSPGMINLDFSDIKAVMKNKGQAMMGNGEHSGENRAKVAAEMALNNPLLDNSSIDGASSILLNIKGGLDLALFEVDEAASLIRSKVNENANIIFGSSIDESLDGIINISVVATGINQSVYDQSVNNQSVNNIEEVDRSINQTNLGEIEDHSSEIEGQIDLESKIADLNKISHSDNVVTESEKDSLTFLETKEKELSNILNKNEDNLKDQTEENPFLKKISNLFSNNKNDVEKLEKNNEFYPLKNIVKNQIDEQNKPLINLSEPSAKSENKSEQISLLEIEENHKSDNLDDVLEIPAFLRRQANWRNGKYKKN